MNIFIRVIIPCIHEKFPHVFKYFRQITVSIHPRLKYGNDGKRIQKISLELMMLSLPSVPTIVNS